MSLARDKRKRGDKRPIPDDRKTLDLLGRQESSPVPYLQPPLLVASSEWPDIGSSGGLRVWKRQSNGLLEAVRVQAGFPN